MPSAPPRPCPRCRRLFRGPACPRCERRREQQRARPSAHDRGYTATWAVYARRWLEKFPWCGQRLDGRLHDEHSRCAAIGLRVRAQVVDHIRRLRDGGARFDPMNHQSLCVSCNTAKDAPRAASR